MMTGSHTAARWLAGGLAVLAVGLAGWYAFQARQLPQAAGPESPATAVPLPEWAPAALLPPEAWTAIQRGGATVADDAGPLADRYRLAGTYFLFGDATESAQAQRTAVLDDLQKNEQHLVREGDAVDEFEVARVFEDRVFLRHGGVEYELKLSFASAPVVASSGLDSNASATNSLEDQPALETSRFGKRVGANRWVFSREELLKYYREVLDEPERIAALYMSLKPDYQENEVAGYQLDGEGEQEFFQAVGLQDGDVVRRVNSMRMVSQRRAEYFISEFLKNRVSALVLDIERGGKPEKMIYLIR
jgi:type II secretory pathway component PulC